MKVSAIFDVFVICIYCLGYDIFIISGELPECEADLWLRIHPVDPTVARARSSKSAASVQSDKNISSATSVGNVDKSNMADLHDKELRAAIALSRRELEANDSTLQRIINETLPEGAAADYADDDENDETFRQAIKASLQESEEDQMREALQLSLSQTSKDIYPKLTF